MTQLLKSGAETHIQPGRYMKFLQNHQPLFCTHFLPTLWTCVHVVTFKCILYCHFIQGFIEVTHISNLAADGIKLFQCPTHMVTVLYITIISVSVPYVIEYINMQCKIITYKDFHFILSLSNNRKWQK